MDYFKDDGKRQSSMRLVWALVTLTIFGVWAYLSIITRKFIDFTVGDSTLIGLLFGGKVGQKYIEKMSNAGDKSEDKKP